jgi:transcription elongation factor Elf1
MTFENSFFDLDNNLSDEEQFTIIFDRNEEQKATENLTKQLNEAKSEIENLNLQTNAQKLKFEEEIKEISSNLRNARLEINELCEKLYKKDKKISELCIEVVSLNEEIETLKLNNEVKVEEEVETFCITTNGHFDEAPLINVSILPNEPNGDNDAKDSTKSEKLQLTLSDKVMIITELQRSDIQRSETAMRQKNFKCANCARIFKREHILLRHLKTHEREQQKFHKESRKAGIKSLAKIKTQLNVKKKMIKCRKCDGSFKTERGLHVHITRIHSKPAVGNKKPKQNQKIEKVVEKKIKNPKLNKNSKTTQDKKIKKVTKKKERKYECPVCDFATNSRKFYYQHVDKHDEHNRGAFRCKKCNFSTDVNIELLRHANVHLALYSRLVKCELCEFANVDRYKVNRHMNVHAC